MVVIESKYEGGLSCRSVHGPSGTVLLTDAPADMGGDAQSFSPTDLTATSFLTCIMTTMVIVAKRHDLDLSGMSGRVEKTMSTGAPRRIAELNVLISMPISETHPLAELMMRTAEGCPVHQSLHLEVEKIINWSWKSGN